MVGVTGCGCPVDTSVHSTEAPTEAAAETLNPWLPLAVPEIVFRLGAPNDFDRCASSSQVSYHSFPSKHEKLVHFTAPPLHKKTMSFRGTAISLHRPPDALRRRCLVPHSWFGTAKGHGAKPINLNQKKNKDHR